MERPSKTPIAIKTCPACSSAEYLFRVRKKIAAEPGSSEVASVETNYRCKACGEEWRVSTLASGPE